MYSGVLVSQVLNSTSGIMGFWALPISMPILLGSHRLIEKVSLTFDFMVFEIVMCAILYLITRGILLIKVFKLEKVNEEANHFFERLSKEPNSAVQSMCLQRCLDISEAALNEYDSLLLYFGQLQHLPSRRVCLQRLPLDPQLLRKPSTEESFQCLKTSLSCVPESFIFPQEMNNTISVIG
ncbi:UNVERIFIED_CONTAM: hypothetical protein PYX00_006255 [Menopon gallinae]|uniref:Uncharacterized protein n=1 Tax=Menopon gallinae TaxID=328185 RepID=A0AAW2HWJ2_9NEOP